jgi:EAL domain-containing protein (putative c-di-GMP-specific phosphodiesterase class I)
VNVSAAQFRRENLDAQVRNALRESGLEPSSLELEITEGVLIEDIARAKNTMRALKSLGIQIALDDFGTGYSSLSYLEAFPLDRIKIDRSFVASLGKSNRSLAVVRAVIGLAHGLGVPVLAEGIESQAQMSLLLQEGCDEMQGYLIGRPGKASRQAELAPGVRAVPNASALVPKSSADKGGRLAGRPRAVQPPPRGRQGR